MKELRNILDHANTSKSVRSDTTTPPAPETPPEREEDPGRNRRSIADRMAALSNAGINTSPSSAYSYHKGYNSHPQPNPEALQSATSPASPKKPLPRVQENTPTPPPSSDRPPLHAPEPKLPDEVLAAPEPPELDPRPASQPLARSAADEAEQAFHDHFPSVDALEQGFPSMPDVPRSIPGSLQPGRQMNGNSSSSHKKPLPDPTTSSPMRRSPGMTTLTSSSSQYNATYSSLPHNSSQPVASTSKAAQQAPEEPQLPLNNAITPAALSSYLSTTQSPVLVIDVRPRPAFEKAHLQPPNDRSAVVCIEPIALRHALDSTQLSKNLFDCPKAEKEAFDARHSYSLIVVTDYASTTMPSSASQAAMNTEAMFLFHLNQAIYVNEFRAPLSRPPVLLVGGMSAWGEAYGSKYLKGSLIDAHHQLQRGANLRRGSMSHDADVKRANRRAQVTEGEMYGMNIARNVGDVVCSIPISHLIVLSFIR